MIPEIELHRDEIIAICEEFGLERLELFGSAATGEFEPERSDVDFLVVISEGFDYGLWGSRVEELRDRLEQAHGRKVDLASLRWIRNPYFKRSVEESRRPLYAS